MPLSISLDIANIGVPATYWSPIKLQADLVGLTTTVTYAGWASSAAYAAGANPIGGALHSITLNPSNDATMLQTLAGVLSDVESTVAANMAVSGVTDLFAGAVQVAAVAITPPPIVAPAPVAPVQSGTIDPGSAPIGGVPVTGQDVASP